MTSAELSVLCTEYLTRKNHFASLKESLVAEQNKLTKDNIIHNSLTMLDNLILLIKYGNPVQQDNSRGQWVTDLELVADKLYQRFDKVRDAMNEANISLQDKINKCVELENYYSELHTSTKTAYDEAVAREAEEAKQPEETKESQSSSSDTLVQGKKRNAGIGEWVQSSSSDTLVQGKKGNAGIGKWMKK